jgi:ABC-2 type transport system permease protein
VTAVAPTGRGAAAGAAPTDAAAAPADRRFTGGWRIVAGKELSDHVRSIRFVLIIAIVALAGLAAIHSSSRTIRDAAQNASGTPSIFLYLFTLSPDRIPAFDEFIGFLGPLLGIALGFDAVSAERNQRTLSRLVAQPIHRDDILLGKFLAGLAAVSVAISCVITIVAGYGILRLGLVPSLADLARVVAFFVVAVVYVGVWLALAILLSIVSRKAATIALGTIAVWLLMAFFAGLISGSIADAVHPTDANSTPEQVYANSQLDQHIHRLSPTELYQEAVDTLLDPASRTTSDLVASSRLDQAIPSSLSLSDSLGVAWWQIVSLVAMAVILFVVAFISFMRQEVRA